MRLGLQQFYQQLESQLASIYLLSGDEPQQMMEAADAIRARARQEGYDEREVFTVDKDFNWQSLVESSNSMSLFAQRRILDLRMPSGKPGREGSQALRDYAERPPEDTILLIQTGKLEKGADKSSWYKALDAAGVVVQIWPLDLKQTQQWVLARAQKMGLKLNREATDFIAERVEGNLLAAAQELDKLLLLHGETELDMEAVLSSVADQSRYSVFDLVDAVLAGEKRRCLRLLEGLRAEGVEPILILWGLAREIRGLYDMGRRVQRGEAVEQVMASARVWNQRKPLVRQALSRLNSTQLQDLLRRCGEIDRSVKGVGEGSVWDELLQLIICACGDCLFAEPATQ
ncbi:MAG: DNA polymerase III subunit delta [Gammaproteobacteria bacterium]|nr:DNA polymerase III subunit delta [Gammaproteobacteria bacterium]